MLLAHVFVIPFAKKRAAVYIYPLLYIAVAIQSCPSCALSAYRIYLARLDKHWLYNNLLMQFALLKSTAVFKRMV